MNKLLCLLTLFVLINSCDKRDNKTVSYSDRTDYVALNSYIKDSLPSLNSLNKDYSDILSKWKDIEIIVSSSKIMSSDSKQLSLLLENLKIDIKKINDKRFYVTFDVPQIIGRFRVFKTNILKINSNKIEDKDVQTFKNNLKSIIISYNALINMINEIAKKSDEEKTEFKVSEK